MQILNMVNLHETHHGSLLRPSFAHRCQQLESHNAMPDMVVFYEDEDDTDDQDNQVFIDGELVIDGDQVILNEFDQEQLQIHILDNMAPAEDDDDDEDDEDGIF